MVAWVRRNLRCAIERRGQPKRLTHHWRCNRIMELLQVSYVRHGSGTHGSSVYPARVPAADPVRRGVLLNTPGLMMRDNTAGLAPSVQMCGPQLGWIRQHQ